MVIILQIAGITLITTFLFLIIKEQKPNLAFLLVLFVGCGLFIIVMDQIQILIRLIDELASYASIHPLYVQTILKIIGIAYITEFASQITKDAGLQSLAGKMELVGKILILVLSVPIFTALMETIVNMLQLK